MNYIGSKHTLLPFIEQTFRKIGDGDETTACELFAGTESVGRLFKRLGLLVIANDLQRYAYALNKAYIEINEQPGFLGLRQTYKEEFARLGDEDDMSQQTLAFVNSLPGTRGFIAKNYG